MRMCPTPSHNTGVDAVDWQLGLLPLRKCCLLRRRVRGCRAIACANRRWSGCELTNPYESACSSLCSRVSMWPESCSAAMVTRRIRSNSSLRAVQTRRATCMSRFPSTGALHLLHLCTRRPFTHLPLYFLQHACDCATDVGTRAAPTGPRAATRALDGK